MDHKQNKLGNPERLAELSPKATLMRIGLGEQDIICDIGAGSGIFTIPAARITKNIVYAMEINDEFLEVIKEKAATQNLPNIVTMKVTGDHYDIQQRQTPMGPPALHRLSKEEVTEMCGAIGFDITGEFDLGENLYCLLLESA